MMISAGKSRKNVDAYVLLPPDCVRAVQTLISSRDTVGIRKSNAYIFARLSAETPLSGHVELQEVAYECSSLQHPERIKSTNLRRYIATVTQV